MTDRLSTSHSPYPWTDGEASRLTGAGPGRRTAPPGDDDALRAAAPVLTRAVYDAVAGLGGSSAEHGLGVLKRDAAAAHTSEAEVAR